MYTVPPGVSWAVAQKALNTAVQGWPRAACAARLGAIRAVSNQTALRYTLPMCGRFSQSRRPSRYAEALDPEWQPASLELQPSWNVTPGRDVLVFYDAESGHVAALLHWGFLPAWADAGARKPINARVETAARSPYFRHAWMSGRCLIPADGWYEWQAIPGGKLPYYIHRADGEPVFLAGLYEANRHENIASFAILTTEASGALRGIHEREPLVLPVEAARRWMRRDSAAEEVAALAGHALASTGFAWHAISTRVNNARNDDPELIAPV